MIRPLAVQNDPALAKPPALVEMQYCWAAFEVGIGYAKEGP